MFFKIKLSQNHPFLSLFTFLQKGTKPKCLPEKKADRLKIPSRKHLFPPPPQGPIPAAGLGRQSEGGGEAAAREEPTADKGSGHRESYRSVNGGLGTGRGSPAQLQAGPWPPAASAGQLGLQRAGPGPGCLLRQAHVAAAVAAQNRLEGTRASSGPAGPLREAGALSPKGPAASLPSAEAAGRSLGLGWRPPPGPAGVPGAHRATSCSSPEACF